MLEFILSSHTFSTAEESKLFKEPDHLLEILVTVNSAATEMLTIAKDIFKEMSYNKKQSQFPHAIMNLSTPNYQYAESMYLLIELFV